MIFSGPHYYLGLIQVALAVCYVLLGVFAAGRNKWVDRIAAWVIGAYLLMYKSWEYGPFSTVPVDLSAISYFLFGVAAFVPFRPVKAAGSVSAMLSGAVYFFTMILYPETHVESLLANRWYLLIMAMVNHNLMFAGGLFLCARNTFRRTDCVWVLGWFAFYLAYYELVTAGYGMTSNVTAITGILDGSLVAGVLGLPLTAGYYVGYYIIVILALALIASVFVLLNRAFARRRERKGVFLPAFSTSPLAGYAA